MDTEKKEVQEQKEKETVSFWVKVREDLKKAAQEGWAAVKDGAKIAAEKSEEVARVGKFRYQAYTSHRQAEKLFTELGGTVYDLAKPPYENPLSNSKVMKLVEDIRKVEEESAELEKKIEEVKKKEPTEPPQPV